MPQRGRGGGSGCGDGSASLVAGPSEAQLESADMALLYAGTPQRCTFLELQARASHPIHTRPPGTPATVIWIQCRLLPIEWLLFSGQAQLGSLPTTRVNRPAVVLLDGQHDHLWACWGVQGRGISAQAVIEALRQARDVAADVAAAQQHLVGDSGRAKRDVPTIRADPAALHNASR